MEVKSRMVRGRGFALVVVGVLIGTLFLTPAGAHYRSRIGHIWTHLSPRVVEEINNRALTKTIQPGETVRGTIGYTGPPDAEGYGGALVEINAQLPAAAPVPLDSKHVTDAAGTDKDEAACTGTVDNPTAPPGHVCIYGSYAHNASFSYGSIPRGQSGITKWGFTLGWTAPQAATTSVWATWAYTAPSS